MSLDIAESDWKVFKKLHAIALERFFQRAIQEMRAHLDVDGTPAKEKFWEFFDFAAERRKLAVKLFDDYRRSTAILIMSLIARHKLVTEQELAEFTPEALQEIQCMRKF